MKTVYVACYVFFSRLNLTLPCLLTVVCSRESVVESSVRARPHRVLQEEQREAEVWKTQEETHLAGNR